MNRLVVNQIVKQCKLHGRTYMDPEDGILYFNWTCGGLEAKFSGTCLVAEFCALPDSRIGHITDNRSESIEKVAGSIEEKAVQDWPWIAVIVDGAEEPYQKILLDQPEKKVILFSDENAGCHRIRIVKLNENYRTAVGIRALLMDGVLQECGKEYEERKKIEFIGDSITCGFGNMAVDGTREFYTAEENGWLTHGAIAARMLNMDAAFISVSGITVTRYNNMPAPYVMEELYPYKDRIMQDKLGRSEHYELWDFERNPSDYIVLNLGTNDSTVVMLSGDPAVEEAVFEENYIRFIRTVRELNGPRPWLICALGCIDYYLYDTIQRAVEKIRHKTGDQRIFCMKYTKMLTMGPDVGAGFHPSAYRQEKMAEELVNFIRKLEEKEHYNYERERK